MKRKMVGNLGPVREAYVKAPFVGAMTLMLFLGSIVGFGLEEASPVGEADAAPNPIPILSLSLYPSQLKAMVTQSQQGAVTFYGNATVEKMSGVQRVTVTLNAVVSTGWPVVVSRQTMVFVDPGTEQFQVSVIVPPATSSLITGNVIVSGSAKAPGLSPVVATASAVVTVDQYFKARIEAESPLREVKPGELTFNVVNVYNDGNGLDSFELEISNNKELVECQFTILLGSTDMSVSQDEYSPVKITIQTPQEWRLYAKEIHTITVKVTSAEARSSSLLYSKEYPIFIYMKGTYIPGFDAFFAIFAIVGAVAAAKVSIDKRSGGRVKRENQTP